MSSDGASMSDERRSGGMHVVTAIVMMEMILLLMLADVGDLHRHASIVDHRQIEHLVHT
jgi:hypothetical protein